MNKIVNLICQNIRMESRWTTYGVRLFFEDYKYISRIRSLGVHAKSYISFISCHQTFLGRML